MIQPAETIVETRHVVVFSRCRYGLSHCSDGFRVTSKVCLKDCEIKQSILIECAVPIVHGVIEIAVEVIE